MPSERNPDAAPAAPDHPEIATIVVPSYNRPEQLRSCLEALVGQEGVEFEVIVVDDGSPAPLASVCAPFAPTVRYLRQANAGPAKARNAGAAAARGSFLAFTDDDCRPRPDWLKKLRSAHAGLGSVLVGGRVENGLPDDPFATASQELCDFLYHYFGAARGDVPFFTSNNIGLSRDGFERLGGFDESFPLAAAEDRDFGIRWREDGGRMVYAGDAVIDHFHGMDLRRFWRQHSNYGKGAFHLHGLMAARGSELPRREPFAFYLRLVFFPIGRRGLRGLRTMCLLALSQLAMINGYLKATRCAQSGRGGSDGSSRPAT